MPCKQIMDSKDLATKQDLLALQHNMTVIESNLRKDMAEIKSEMMRAMLLQTFAIAGLVIAVVKFMN